MRLLRDDVDLDKDTYVTDPTLGMPTSGGAAFFAALTAKQNGTIVQRVCLSMFRGEG